MSFYTNVSRRHNDILYRGYDDSGNRVQYRRDFYPTLYIGSGPKNKSDGWKTIRGKDVSAITPGTMSDCQEFLKTYQDVENFEIYGNTQWIYQYISSLVPAGQEFTYDYNTIRVGTIDIETESEEGFPDVETANERVNLITVLCKNHKYVFGLQPVKLPDDVIYRQHDTEEQLLMDFIDIWKQLDLDVITGWYVRFFDIPYLIHRINRLFGEDKAKSLSPWNKITSEEVEVRGKVANVYVIEGIDTLDYQELYRKYSLNPQESYTLDHIASVELGKRKIPWTEKYDYFREFYSKDYQLFAEYNLHDADLVVQLENKLNFLSLHISVAYTAGINYVDVFSQVRTWDMLIYNHLNAKKVVIPLKKTSGKDEQYAGAYVKDPTPGEYKWIVSFDLASLYPNLIRFLNISPDTIVDRKSVVTVDEFLEQKIDLTDAVANNCSIGANGQWFKKDYKGFLPELMEKFFKRRKVYKSKMLEAKKKLEEPNLSPEDEAKYKKDAIQFDVQQMAAKISLNSAYGALGNQYFRYFDLNQAEAITLTGQLAIRWIQKHLNDYLNKLFKTTGVDYVIGSDTDSCYLNLEPLVKTLPNSTPKEKIVDVIDRFCIKYLQPFISERFAELHGYMNAMEQTLEMKREVIADRALWTAKKRYCLQVWDAEGVRYKTPKIKITGLETQRSSTPKVCREGLKEAIRIIMNEDQQALHKFVADFREKFMSAPLIDISFPRGINGMNEYADANTIFSKATPIAVKGALVYNHTIDRMNLTKKYTKISDGDKIKFLYLKVPNPLHNTVVSFPPSQIPKEFELDKYADKEMQYVKTFSDPLTSILEVKKWTIEPRSSLESFFA